MWLQPKRFVQAAPGEAAMAFLVGHGPDRQRWDVDVRRVAVLRSIGPKGTVDQRASLKPGGLGVDVPVRLTTPGVHVIVLQSLAAESNLPALRFNDYLKQEGLTPAQRFRDGRGISNQPGRESYSRRAKTLVQVGPSRSADLAVLTRPVGLTLEIVPEANPLAAGAKTLPVRVIFEGKPLAGALVKLTNLDADSVPVDARLTDPQGRATFQIPKPGAWLMNVLWTKPISGHPKADFETTFSSLTFGSR